MIDRSNLAIIILAAGKGSRMKSNLPKVMHKIAGRPMLSWLIEQCENLNPDKLIVVTAPHMDEVAKTAPPHLVAIQKEQRGTGDAVRPALEHLKDFKGRILILLGDEPFIDLDVIRNMIAYDGIAAMAVTPPNPTGLGRLVIEESSGYLERIIEEKDCTPEQRSISSCNAGNYCLPAEKLEHWLDQINNNNAQNEYYLTDLPEIARQEGTKTKIFNIHTDISWGINTRQELADHEKQAQTKLREQAMLNGVTFLSPETVTLSWDTQFGQDITIEPNVYIGGQVTIKNNVMIHAFSHIEGAVIEANAEIGPYARIRPQSIIGEGATIGNFIEINRSTIQAGAKAKHVSYLGDTVVGENSNIGAGTVIANYDGCFKHECHIGKNVFIGSNSTIISPVKIGAGSIIAAGSNINKDIKEDAMAIGRSRQKNYDNWATQYRNVKQEQKRLQKEKK